MSVSMSCGWYLLQFDMISSAVQEVSAVISPAVVYPNPAKDLIRINNLPIQASGLEIIDMKGTVVSHAESWQAGEPLDVADLPPGCYLVRMVIGQQVTVSRFIRAD